MAEAPGGAAVEAEYELVEVGRKMLLADRAVMGAQQPALDEAEHQMDGGQPQRRRPRLWLGRSACGCSRRRRGPDNRTSRRSRRAAGGWLGWAALPSVVVIGAAAALLLALAQGLGGAKLALTGKLAFGPHLALAFWLVWLLGPLSVG